jgi:hypothetical protein
MKLKIGIYAGTPLLCVADPKTIKNQPGRSRNTRSLFEMLAKAKKDNETIAVDHKNLESQIKRVKTRNEVRLCELTCSIR